MDKRIKITLITNLCTHYKVKFFERLSQLYLCEFLFTSDGRESYWESKNPKNLGDFKGEHLGGFWLTRKLRILPTLISKLLKTDSTVIIKDITGRFALPVTFILAKLRGKKFILRADIWQHPKTFFHFFSFPFTKFIYKHCDAICAWGKHIKDYLVSLGVDAKKIFIAIQAVDNEKYEKTVLPDEIASLRDELGIGSRKVSLFVSQVEIHKGIYYLIEAVEKFDSKEMVLIIIGRGSQLEEIKKIAKAKNRHNIIFLDYVENSGLYRYYALADVFVLPSITTREYKEPWGLVVNEAMNQGCPVVVTEAVGAAAGGMVSEGKNGHIVSEKDSEALYEAMDNVLSNNELCNEMGIQSKKIIQNWSYEQTLEGFVKAINFVLKP